MWFCKFANSPQILGPLSDSQLRTLAREGRLQPTDAVAKDRNGPWYPASQVRGLFLATGETQAANQRLSHDSSPGRLSEDARPSSPPQTSSLMASPEYLIRQRARRRKQARKLTLTLLWGSLGLGLVLILLLIRPVISPIFQTSRGNRPTARQAAKTAIPKDDSSSAQVVASIPGLDEVLGHTSAQKSDTSKSIPETGPEARMATFTKLAAASRLFGTTAQKMRDSHGNIEMAIEDCKIGPVSLQQRGLTVQTTKPYLSFKLHVRNTSATERSSYRSPRDGNQTAEIWWEKAPEPVSPWQRAGYTLEGQASDSSLGPGESVVDTFAFLPPPEDVSLVYIRIPGAAIGLADEDFFFVISKDDIQRLDKPSAAAGVAKIADEGSIGPMAPRGTSDNTGVGRDASQAEEKASDLDEEAIPIPGIHDVPQPSVSQDGMSEEEDAKQKELRSRSEMMQNALDRQRKNQKAAPRSQPRRR
ncbi:MAG: GYF domain-containing protein [Thermogutta sp.]